MLTADQLFQSGAKGGPGSPQDGTTGSRFDHPKGSKYPSMGHIYIYISMYISICIILLIIIITIISVIIVIIVTVIIIVILYTYHIYIYIHVASILGIVKMMVGMYSVFLYLDS